MIWIPITIGAATLQVARNAAQRSVMGGAGPWGATLVRFLFGLPFATAFAVVAWILTPGAQAASDRLVLAGLLRGGGGADQRHGRAVGGHAPLDLRPGHGHAAERPAVRPDLGRDAVMAITSAR
jgi:hypothetical protein